MIRKVVNIPSISGVNGNAPAIHVLGCPPIALTVTPAKRNRGLKVCVNWVSPSASSTRLNLPGDPSDAHAGRDRRSAVPFGVPAGFAKPCDRADPARRLPGTPAEEAAGGSISSVRRKATGVSRPVQAAGGLGNRWHKEHDRNAPPSSGAARTCSNSGRRRRWTRASMPMMRALEGSCQRSRESGARRQRELAAPGRDGAPDVPLLYRLISAGTVLPYPSHPWRRLCRRWCAAVTLMSNRYGRNTGLRTGQRRLPASAQTPPFGAARYQYMPVSAWPMRMRPSSRSIRPDRHSRRKRRRAGCHWHTVGSAIAAITVAFQQLVYPMLLDDRPTVEPNSMPASSSGPGQQRRPAAIWGLSRRVGICPIKPAAVCGGKIWLACSPALSSGTPDLFIDEDLAYAA